jgi:hypothetical protein
VFKIINLLILIKIIAIELYINKIQKKIVMINLIIIKKIRVVLNLKL